MTIRIRVRALLLASLLLLGSCGQLGEARRDQIDGATSGGSSGSPAVPTPEPDPITAFAAGDLANRGDGDDLVADMIASHDPDAFLALGDTVYDTATKENYERYYADTYGRLDDVVWPTPGNHDYSDGGADAYQDYYAENAPHVPQAPYYAVDIGGGWRLLSLNSEIDQGDEGSRMYRWLEDELSGDLPACMAAIWHSPIYTIGRKPYDEDGMRPIYDLLLEHGVDLVLVGHDHNYQRWDVDGIAYFVVGTGGKARYEIEGTSEDVAFSTDDVDGALELRLGPRGGEFRYRTAEDEVIDSGSFGC